MNPWADAQVAEMLDRSAYLWPDNEAVVDGQQRITLRDLVERRDRLAAVLSERGVDKGTVVGTYLGECWQHVVLIYALLYLGARIVPLNLTWEERELRFAIEKADVEHIVAAKSYRGKPLWGRLPNVPIASQVSVADFPMLRSVIGFDRDQTSQGDYWLGSMLTRSPLPVPRRTLQEGLLMFTSGSTAFPKGALIRQDAALGTSYFVGERLGLGHQDRILNVLPFYHCGGLITVLLGAHQRGAAVHLFEGVNVDAMVEALHRERCTVMIGFDAVNLKLIREVHQRGLKLPVEKMQVTIGASYDELTEVGVRTCLCYALTESSNFVSMTEPEEDERGRHSNGYPLPGIEVRICDRETGQVLAPEVPGEICFRGWNLISGYYKDAELTRSAIDEDGYLHTGDYGWLDKKGRVYYRGRFAMMIKSGGENVSEIEVENFLMLHFDEVLNAAVVGVPDERWGESVVAFIESQGPLDGEAIQDACRGKLARFKIPKYLFEIDSSEWPLTPTGKLKKDTLREMAGKLVSDRNATSSQGSS